MAKRDVWMPFYIADYLADTARFTTEEHGAYLLLIIDYWRSGPLPCTKSVLCNVTKLSGRGARTTLDNVLAKFTLIDGRYHHKRIDAELARAKERAEIARENGKSGGNPAFKKGKPNPYKPKKEITQSITQTDNPEDNPGDKLSQSQSHSTSTVVLESKLSRTPNGAEREKPKVKLPMVQYGEFLRMAPEQMDTLERDHGAAAVRSQIPKMDRWIKTQDPSINKNVTKYRRPQHNHYLFANGWMDRAPRAVATQQRLSVTEHNEKFFKEQIDKLGIGKPDEKRSDTTIIETTSRSLSDVEDHG